MAKQDSSGGEITLQMVMNHMQAGFASLRSEMQAGFAAVRKEMQEGVHTLRQEMTGGFSRVWRRFDWIDTSLGNLNARLDDIEIESLPKRVAALERKVHR